MEQLVTSQEMQQFDDYTVKQVGMSALVLMERAAQAVVEIVLQQSTDLNKVAVICGYGNNGADGVAVARLLKLKNIDVTIYLVGNPELSSAAMKQQLHIASVYQVPMITTQPQDFHQYTLIIDALFGIGLSREIVNEFATVINAINQSQVKVVAIDLPSGIDADNGQILGCAIKADLTVTFGYNKLGLVLFPGADYAGQVSIADIGIYANKAPVYYSLQADDLVKLIPQRANHSHKGTFGKVLVIAGSNEMSGAAYFSAKAAYRTGAGLVQIYTHQSNRAILLSQLPEALITTYDTDKIDEQQLQQLMQWATVIVIGPGIGLSASSYQILTYVLMKANVPVIIDADGLNMLPNLLHLISRVKYPVFITPHVGEMARLCKTDIKLISENMIQAAQQCTNQYHVTCILKDARTVISSPDNQTICINQSGNNGMAKGGSGDVLTGILAGLIAQGIDLSYAAQVGVYLHGLAGNEAAKAKGQYSMLPTDLIEQIENVLLTTQHHD